MPGSYTLRPQTAPAPKERQNLDRSDVDWTKVAPAATRPVAPSARSPVLSADRRRELLFQLQLLSEARSRFDKQDELSREATPAITSLHAVGNIMDSLRCKNQEISPRVRPGVWGQSTWVGQQLKLRRELHVRQQRKAIIGNALGEASAAPDSAAASFRPRSHSLPPRAKTMWAERVERVMPNLTQPAHAAKPFDGRITSIATIAQSVLNAGNRRIVAVLRGFPCFKSASPMQLSMLVHGAKMRSHPRYTAVYREGATAHSFYLLLRGVIRLASNDRGDGELLDVEPSDPFRPEACLGTECLTPGMRRNHTATCEGECTVLQFRTFAMTLDAAGTERLARRTFAAFVEAELRRMPLFFSLREPAVRTLSYMFELEEIGESGRVVFRPGAVADAFYILLHGQIVLTEPDGLVVAKLEAGATEEGFPFFGEAAFLADDAERMEQAATRTPCTLLAMRRANFERVARLVPALRERFEEFHDLRRNRVDLIRMAHADKEKAMAERRRSLAAAKEINKAAAQAAPNPDAQLGGVGGEGGEGGAEGLEEWVASEEARPVSVDEAALMLQPHLLAGDRP